MEFENIESIAYSGNQSQLESFAAELVKAGFTPDDDSDFEYYHEYFGKWVPGKKSIITYPDKTFGFYGHDGGDDTQFRADQSAEALAAAIKTAEV